MKKMIRYATEGALLLVIVALLLIGRVTGFMLAITIVMLIGLEINDRMFHNTKCRNSIMILLASVVLWMFNDLMAIGRIVGVFDIVSLMNLLIYVMIFLLVAGLTGRIKLTLLISETVLFFIGILNAVIKAIRRTPISAGDIFSVKTAMAVAGNYSMEFDKEFVLKVGIGIVIVILLNLILYSYFAENQEGGKKQVSTVPVRLLCVVISGIYFIVMVTTSWIVKAGGRNADYFTHETNGFAFNLYLQLKDMAIQEPQNYTEDSLQALIAEYPSDQISENNTYPNIIVIMNESFADMSVLGDFTTNEEVLPFLNSMKDNTIKGKLYSSVYGGNTANSEYEFLTGSSIAYFSERVVPFQLYMNETRPSVISQMNQLGYDTVFMHPYKAYSWNRPSVYSALGTSQMYYEEDMPELTLIRGYGSDRSQNDYLIKYLNQERDNPVFLYDVTVQNHGGYTGNIPELGDKITVTGHEGEYVETENYLTLVHESDKALEELITYLKDYDEPTAVLFFGDHQPAVETSFIEMAEGKKQSDFTMEDRQDMYTVPFFLWANYDIEEKEIDKISINYLSTLLCKELGLPMTGFQKYLDQLYQEFPVINSVCVVDRNDHYMDKNALEGVQKELFDEYCTIIYNYMFDKGSRMTEFFTLQE